MIISTNLEKCKVHIRFEIIKQAGIPSDRVLNALSVRGIDLEKKFDDIIQENLEGTISPDLSDVLILFDVSFNTNGDNNVSYSLEDQSILLYSANKIKIMIYGKYSEVLANRLVSRFRTEKVKIDLFNKGVYIEEVENPESSNEIINNTIWMRTDINIKFSHKSIIQSIDEEEYFEGLPQIIIKEK